MIAGDRRKQVAVDLSLCRIAQRLCHLVDYAHLLTEEAPHLPDQFTGACARLFRCLAFGSVAATRGGVGFGEFGAEEKNLAE
jgi:hypothetical protein